MLMTPSPATAPIAAQSAPSKPGKSSSPAPEQTSTPPWSTHLSTHSNTAKWKSPRPWLYERHYMSDTLAHAAPAAPANDRRASRPGESATLKTNIARCPRRSGPAGKRRYSDHRYSLRIYGQDDHARRGLFRLRLRCPQALPRQIRSPGSRFQGESRSPRSAEEVAPHDLSQGCHRASHLE